jgi:hypothetical protein
VRLRKKSTEAEAKACFKAVHVRTLGFSDYTHAGHETYPYSPRLVRVTSLIDPLLGTMSPASSVIGRLRSRPRSLRLQDIVVDSPPLSPVLLPPGRASPASPSPHSRLVPPARPIPDRGLGRAEHLAPGRGLMPTPAPAQRLRQLGVRSPSPSSPSPCTSSSGGSHSSTTSWAQTFERSDLASSR